MQSGFIVKWVICTVFFMVVFGIRILIGNGFYVYMPEMSFVEVMSSYFRQPLQMIGLPAILAFFLARYWQSKTGN